MRWNTASLAVDGPEASGMAGEKYQGRQRFNSLFFSQPKSMGPLDKFFGL
jgi:hypothetical protein